ncbi:MAG: OmpA family protein [Rhodospirillales bacterium]
MKRPGIYLALCAGLATAGFLHASALAQEQGNGEVYSEEQYHETQALIDRMQAKIDSINSAASERDKEIEFLNKQIEDAIQVMASGREDNVALRENNQHLKGELKDVYATEGDLSVRLTELAGEKETAVAALRSEVSALNDRLLSEQETSTGLRGELGDLAAKLGAVATEKKSLEEELDQVRQALAANEKTMESRRQEIAGLNREIAALKKARAAMESKVADLGHRLKSAAEKNVREISSYRSEFFGRLRKVLGGNPDIRAVGDRFVFQSEVLFPSGSAELDPNGRSTLTRLAETLKDVAKKIPADVNWMLRVDGHTDRVPIKTWAYQSNWELSTARATSVVKFLVRLGLAPEHLAATGFGEYRALDPRDDEIAYRRNRRIEFKLTQP